MTMTTLKSPLMRCFVGAVLLTLAAGAHAEIRETPLAPVRIVWMSDTTGTDISNAESLLKPFSGQISVNDAANGARLRSRPGRTASLLLDFGKEIYGGLKLYGGMPQSKASKCFRVCLGESVTEAMSSVDIDDNPQSH